MKYHTDISLYFPRRRPYPPYNKSRAINANPVLLPLLFSPLLSSSCLTLALFRNPAPAVASRGKETGYEGSIFEKYARRHKCTAPCTRPARRGSTNKPCGDKNTIAMTYWTLNAFTPPPADHPLSPFMCQVRNIKHAFVLQNPYHRMTGEKTAPESGK